MTLKRENLTLQCVISITFECDVSSLKCNHPKLDSEVSECVMCKREVSAFEEGVTSCGCLWSSFTLTSADLILEGRTHT